jgi:hypothetical protein
VYIVKCKDAEDADSADVADGVPGGVEPTADLLVNGHAGGREGHKGKTCTMWRGEFSL